MPNMGSSKREKEKFVRHSGDRDSFSMTEAFSCASCGIKHAFISQRNFKIHVVFAIIAIILGFVLQIPQSSWLAVVLCITIVFSLEVLNTAIESIVDMTSPQWHLLAMHAKDCAAGAVFVSAIGSIVVALIVYIPPFLALFELA